MSAMEAIAKLLVRDFPKYSFRLRRVPFGYMVCVRRDDHFLVRQEKKILVDELYDIAVEMVGEIERMMWHDTFDANLDAVLDANLDSTEA